MSFCWPSIQHITLTKVTEKNKRNSISSLLVKENTEWDRKYGHLEAFFLKNMFLILIFWQELCFLYKSASKIFYICIHNKLFSKLLIVMLLIYYHIHM